MSIETLLAMSEREGAGERLGSGTLRTDHKRCQACGDQNQGEKLSRCRGCESVWYCNKVSE